MYMTAVTLPAGPHKASRHPGDGLDIPRSQGFCCWKSLVIFLERGENEALNPVHACDNSRWEARGKALLWEHYGIEG